MFCCSVVWPRSSWSLIVTLSLVLATLGSSPPSLATDYNVGPEQTLSSIADVPWASLQPGDRVLIHWRETPYKEKWVLNRRGTELSPIVVRGVRGPNGERPIIDGNGATTPTSLSYWNESRGVLKIGGSSTPSDGLPAWLVVEGLEIRSGRPPFSFTDTDGATQSYSQNAASIYVEKAEHLVIRDCVLHDSGNGLFIGAFDGQTRDILIERNALHSNGNTGSVFHHNAYTAAIGITYQYNRFGALRTGADGNNLKDRSAGLVVRYNWIEDGNRQLDLVDAEDSSVVVDHPSYDETFVYGNVLIESDGEGNSQIVHYGGDSGTRADYRKGTLYFFHNTVVSTRIGNTTLLRLSTNDETADVRNNVLYVSASGSRLAMLSSDGVLDLTHNWVKPGWQPSHGSLNGTINDSGWVTGSDPGFFDELGQDYRPLADSAVIDEGTTLHAGTLPDHEPTRHYVKHIGDELRPQDGSRDLGAFEHCESGLCGLVFGDGFENGFGTWTVVDP